MSDSQNNINIRKQNAVIGALVADAASLGFHWLYDAKRSEKVIAKLFKFIKN